MWSLRLSMCRLTGRRSLLVATLVVASLANPERAHAEPSDLRSQQQLKALQREVRELRERGRALSAEREQLALALERREVLLLMRDYRPSLVQSMSDLTSARHPQARSPLPKKRARARYLESSTGRVYKKNLSALLQRSPVLIALWATWCKPCVSPQEQTHLRQLERRLKRYGVPLISVGVDQWSKVRRDKGRWFYPLWHLEDAHLSLTPEVIFKEVGLGLPLFLLRLPDGSVPYYLAQTLSDESVEEWVTLAVRAKLSYSFE